MDISRINITGDFGGDDDKDIDKLIARADEVEKQFKKSIDWQKEAQRIAKESVDEALQGNEQIIKSNEEQLKSGRELTKEEKARIVLREHLVELDKRANEQYQKVSRIRKIKNQEEAESVKNLLKLLSEIVVIEDLLGRNDQEKQKRLERFAGLWRNYTSTIKDAQEAEQVLTITTEILGGSLEKTGDKADDAAKSIENLSGATDDLSDSNENAKRSTDDLNKSEERAHRDRQRRSDEERNRGGGRGGTRPPAPPGGGGPPGGGPPDPPDDFDWDKYLARIEERRRQLTVELQSAEGAQMRAVERELNRLKKAEEFSEKRAKLENQRLAALERLETLSAAIGRQDDNNRAATRRLTNEYNSLTQKIDEANAALQEGTGNADTLTRSLRDAAYNADVLVDAIDQENDRRRQAVELQREQVRVQIDGLDTEIETLRTQGESLKSVNAKAQVDRQINALLRQRSALNLQLQREDEISATERIRLQNSFDDLIASSAEAAQSARDTDTAYNSILNLQRDKFRERIGELRRQRDAVTDPSAAKALDSQIESAEERLASFLRRFDDGRGTVEQLVESLQSAEYRIDRTLELTREQNEEYERQRELAEINTRGLEQDLRTQRLILDSLKSRTTSLEAQKEIEEALARLRRIEERRQRDILSGNFSESQFDALATDTGIAFKNNVRNRERAIELEREYNAEVERSRDTIKEIENILSDPQPLFKGGITTTEIDKFERALEKLRRQLEASARSGRSVKNLSEDLNQFRIDLENSRVPLNRFELAVQRLRNRLGFLGKAFNDADASGRGFSLFTTLATTVVEPLAAVVLQLAGGLLAVASSAVAAGSALGGALVAGAAQALPVIALLGAGFKSLIDVVQLSNRQRQDEASNLAREARGVGGAADGVNRLKDAQDNLTESQRRLSDARRDAIRQLQDLAIEEQRAQLAAANANLAVIDAQLALQNAIDSGNVLDVRRAQLALKGAQLDERQAETELGRNAVDSARTRRKGVEGSDQVIAAKKALAQAERSLAEARTGGAAAASALSQATARLDEQIKQLSPGQKDLLDGINRLRAVFRSGPFVEIRDIILQPFIAATNAIADLGKDSELVGSFKTLANSISSVLGESIKSLFGPGTRDFLKFINGEAAYNVRVLFEIFGSLASVLEKIATSAAPLFRDVLEGLADTFDRIDDALEREGLTEFFNTTKTALDAWGQVVEESFLLLKNLFFASAPAGNTLVGTFATFLRRINQDLTNPQRQRELKEWFDAASRGLAAFGGALRDISAALFTGLDPTRLQQFAGFISNVVAPAIRGLIEVSGFLADILNLISRIPLAGPLAAIGIEVVVLGKTFATLLGLGRLLFTSFMSLVAATSTLSAATRGLAGSQGMAAATTAMLTAEEAALGVATAGTTAQRAMTGLRGAARGAGAVLQRLGPYGLAAGTALLLFGDVIFDLIGNTRTLTDELNAARDAVEGFSQASKDAAEADLDLRELENQKESINLQYLESGKQLREERKKKRQAESEEERKEIQARIDFILNSRESLRLQLERINNRIAETEARKVNAAGEINEQTKKAAEAFIKALEKAPDPGKQLAPRLAATTPEQRLKVLKEALGLDDETWNSLDKDAQAKAAGLFETLVRLKGDKLTKEDLTVVFTALANNTSIDKALAEIDAGLPKGISIDVLFNQDKLKKEAEAAGKKIDVYLLEKLERLQTLIPAIKLSDADRGRPIAYPRDMADGGLLTATPGGIIVRAAEDGYDEYIITTDPNKRERSATLLERAARRIFPEDKNYGVSEGDPPSLRGRSRSGGVQSTPKNPLAAFFTMFNRAQNLDAQDIPYSWGGGHTTPATPTRGIKSDGKDGRKIVGLDCSSSVSAVLQSAYPGFPTITSGEFPRQSIMRPGRGLATIWSNNKHVFMTFGTEDWGTNSGEPGNGPGFHQHSKSGYTASHPKDLSAKTNQKGILGRTYYALQSRNAAGIDAIEDQYAALGTSARSFNGLSDNNLFARAAEIAIRRGLAPFQQFEYGGTVQGRLGDPVAAIVHAGEVVLSADAAQSLMSPEQTGKTLIKRFLDALAESFKNIKLGDKILALLSGPLKKIPEGLRDFIGQLRNLGIGFKRTAGPDGKSGTEDDRITTSFDEIDNLIVKFRRGKKGRRVAVRINILEAIKDFFDDGGYNPKNDPEVNKLVRGNIKKNLARLRQSLEVITNQFAAYLDNLVNGTIKKFADARDVIIQNLQIAQVAILGKFVPNESGSGGFFQLNSSGNTFFERLTSQAFGSVESIRAEREALIGQRSNLVAEQAALASVINQTAFSLAELKEKQRLLEEQLARLRAERQTEASKPITKYYTKATQAARLTAIDGLITACLLELDAIADQIQAAEAALVAAQDRYNQIPTDIANIDTQIAASQRAEIDAQIALATSGRYTPEEAERFFKEAEDLARQIGDYQALEDIDRARFQLAQGTLVGEQALYSASAQYAQMTGDTAGYTTNMQALIDSQQDQAAGIQKRIDELLGQGYAKDSPEITALRTALVNLNISIKQNTDALNGSTIQNFSTTAWQMFRKAIFDGNNGLLPSYSDAISMTSMPTQPIPSAAIGAMIRADGLVYAHSGERIIPASISRDFGRSDYAQNISVIINEARQTADPMYLAKRLAFELAGR